MTKHEKKKLTASQPTASQPASQFNYKSKRNVYKSNIYLKLNAMQTTTKRITA